MVKLQISLRRIIFAAGDTEIVVKKTVLTVLLILELFLIFFFSAQDSSESSKVSGSVCEVISRLVTPGFDELSVEEQADIVSRFQFAVRKCAHMTEFALLAATAYPFFICVAALSPKASFFTGIAFCSACAFFDELHQSFVPGRAMQITDMLIDICGGIAGALISVLIRRIVIKRIAKKAANNRKAEE